MTPKINYCEILSAAQEYIDDRNAFMRKYPGGRFISHARPELYDAYHRMERAERVLTMVCYVVSISPAIPVNAVRLYNRAFDLAYKQGREPGHVDETRLLQSLLDNA